MIARNETIFKWSLYAAATALCLLVQTGFLQRLEFWGALPFLYPLLAAIPATYEGPLAGSIFSLCVGLVSQSWLPAGFLCSFVSAAAAFLLHGSFRCLILWMQGAAAWEAGALVMVREFCAAAPFVIPLTLLYRSVFRKTRFDD